MPIYHITFTRSAECLAEADSEEEALKAAHATIDSRDLENWYISDWEAEVYDTKIKAITSPLMKTYGELMVPGPNGCLVHKYEEEQRLEEEQRNRAFRSKLTGLPPEPEEPKFVPDTRSGKLF